MRTGLRPCVPSLLPARRSPRGSSPSVLGQSSVFTVQLCVCEARGTLIWAFLILAPVRSFCDHLSPTEKLEEHGGERVCPIHPRPPAVSVPDTWSILSSFSLCLSLSSSHLGTAGPHGINVWVCSASPPKKDTCVHYYHHLVSQHGFTFYHPVHRSHENFSNREMISFFFPFLCSWYRTSSRSSLCTQLSRAPPSGAVAQAFLLTSCRGFQPHVLSFLLPFGHAVWHVAS